jgi:hypothetical protein
VSTVQKKEFTKNGAAKYQIDGGWYFLSRGVQNQGLEPGASINFKWEEFGDDRGRGRPRTITSWAPAQQQSSGRSNGSSSASTPDALILPFISNTVAHAIQAGLIKTPADLLPWVIGAKLAITAPPPRKAPEQTTTDSYADYTGPETGGNQAPDFDDDIPF